MRKTKAQKALEKLESDMFKKHGQNHQFNIFNLSKLSAHFKMKIDAGYNSDEAMISAVETYKEPKK